MSNMDENQENGVTNNTDESQENGTTNGELENGQDSKPTYEYEVIGEETVRIEPEDSEETEEKDDLEPPDEKKAKIADFSVDDNFYQKAKQYWDHVDPNIDSMLGGYTEIDPIDVSGSVQLLSRYIVPVSERAALANKPASDKKKKNLIGADPEVVVRGLDCGCGIGRVTKNVLLKFCDKVDLLEQSPHFLNQAWDYIGPELFAKSIGKTINNGLQEWRPNYDDKYHVIWCQWVTGHLTDDDFVDWLRRAQSALKPNGFIVIKDNHTSSKGCDPDTVDSSVTRPYWLFKEIFKRAGVKLVYEKRQHKFPSGLYPVRMFVLQ